MPVDQLVDFPKKQPQSTNVPKNIELTRNNPKEIAKAIEKQAFPDLGPNIQVEDPDMNPL